MPSLRSMTVLAAASTVAGFSPTPLCVSSRAARAPMPLHVLMGDVTGEERAIEIPDALVKEVRGMKEMVDEVIDKEKVSAKPVEDENQKIRALIDAVADDWLCPITGELPLDPVTAEDGQIYERSAIESYIRRHANALKSPITNCRMGTQLTPFLQASKTIEKLVRSGVIGGDKAESWRKRIALEEELKVMQAKVDGGDAEAMYQMGNWYYTGDKGLAPDPAAAIGLFKRGSRLGDASAMYSWGVGLFKGTGCDQSRSYGIGLIFRAAELGSAAAAFDLGEAFDEGTIGLPKDKWEAKYWYSKVADAKFDELLPEHVAKAAMRAAEPLDPEWEEL